MRLFPRRVGVIIGGGGESLSAGGLMVRWDIERSVDSSLDGGKVDIYNLKAENEAKLEEQYKEIQLFAGYPERYGLIFDGEIKRVWGEWNDLDRIMRLEVSGKIKERVSRNSVVDIVYEGETPLETIVAYIARKMGLEVEDYSHVAALGIVEEDYASGLRPAAKLLDDLLTPRGVSWYEDNGVIRFRANGKAGASRGGVLLISERTGMVGLPQLLSDETGGLKVTCLVDHRLELDSTVEVVSQKIERANGLWKIIRIHHRGDNRHGECVSEIEVRSL